MNTPTTRPAGTGWIVEFVGLPGSGKSTVSHALARLLRSRDKCVSERSFEIAHRMSPASRRLVKGRLAGRALLRHPWAVLSLVLSIARTRQRSWIEAVGKTLDLIYVCGLVAERSRQPGVHLLDQGFFNGLGSICFRASADVPLERLVGLGTRSCGRSPADLVIVLDVDPGTAVDRLSRRPGAASRLERSIATAAFESDLQAAVVSLRQVREALGVRDHAWRVRVVPAGETRPAELLATEIARLIEDSIPAAFPSAAMQESPCA